MAKRKKKRKSGGQVLFELVVSVAIIGLLGSGVWLYAETKDYVSGGNEYYSLASDYTAGGVSKKNSLLDTIATWLRSRDNGDEANMDAIMQAQEAAAMQVTAAPTSQTGGAAAGDRGDGSAQINSGTLTQAGTPVSVVQPTLQVDFAALNHVNPDIVGWIYAGDTVISYPVLQGRDNNTYLKHLYDGSANRVGSIFMDAAAAPDFTDTNSVLYGHHMRDGSMFASLMGYKQQEYYDQHPTMELYTPTGNYLVELFSAYVTNDTADQGCYQFNYATPADYLDFIAEAKGKSTFRSEVTVTETDRIVTLSTCTYETSNARYVVIGKLVPMAAANAATPAAAIGA